MKRKSFISVLFLVFACFMVFANGVEESEEKVTLTFWHTDADTRIVEPLEHLLAEFEARNPDIEVELTAWPADSYWQKYTTAISTGTSPDIFSTRDTELTQLIGMNAIMPLDGYISKWSNASQIPESIWTTLKMFSDKQNIFIIPTYANICCNWYNLNRLSMQGVDVPTTQKQFIEYCEKFADPVHGEYFYTLRGGAGSYDNMFIYVLSHAGAGSFFDENGNCVLSTDACIEGLEEYVSIYHNGWCSKDCVTNAFKQMLAEFSAGTVSMVQHNSTGYASITIPKEQLVNGPALANENGFSAMPTPNLFGSAISSTCEHPDEAARLIEFLAEHEAASYFCEKASKTPVNDLVYGDKWAKEDIFLPTYSSMLNNPNITFYRNPVWLDCWTSLINKTILNDFQEVLLGTKSAEEAIVGWAKTLEEEQKAYIAR